MLTSSIRTVRLPALFICLGTFSASALLPLACGGSGSGTSNNQQTSTVANSNGDRDRNFRANLTGFEETPAIVGNGTGHLRLTVHDNTSIDFELTFSGLTGAASAAHIHIGQRAQAGGVTIFFCGGGGRPACPGASGTVTGTITASDVLALPAQGIDAGDLAAVLRAMRAGVTYGNVHTAAHTGGEIRGQIHGGGGHDDEGGED